MPGPAEFNSLSSSSLRIRHTTGHRCTPIRRTSRARHRPLVCTRRPSIAFLCKFHKKSSLLHVHHTTNRKGGSSSRIGSVSRPSPLACSSNCCNRSELCSMTTDFLDLLQHCFRLPHYTLHLRPLYLLNLKANFFYSPAISSSWLPSALSVTNRLPRLSIWL